MLSALPAQEIRQLAKTFEDACKVEDLSLPQSGLALLKLRDTALNETFYLGEIPLAKAHVSVRAADGRIAEGGGQILDDRASMARDIAILDAVLSGKLIGWENVEALLLRGAAVRQEEVMERKRLLDATRVDFSLLGKVEGEEGND
jgi:alpha-D-ribose 1-methylphosphonate 5-triphosphate synthase subunit PhnG